MERDRIQGSSEREFESQINTQSKELIKHKSESPEIQPLPNVWKLLERRVRIQERYSALEKLPGRYVRDKLHHDDLEVSRLEDQVDKKGTGRDKLIFDLFYHTQPVLSLSLEDFHNFRLKIEQMSDAELAEKLHKHFEAIRDKTPTGSAFYPRVGLFDSLKRKNKKP